MVPVRSRYGFTNEPIIDIVREENQAMKKDESEQRPTRKAVS